MRYFVLILVFAIKMADLMTPEEAKDFVEKCNRDYANRYSDKDSDYVQVASNVGKSEPPIIKIEFRNQDRDYHHHQRNPHYQNHNRSHHSNHHHRDNRDNYRRY